MEAQITISNNWQSPTSEVFCQSLPCRIKHRGEAQVNAYFNRCIDEKILGIQSDNADGGEKYVMGSFRGHPLEGKDVEIPDGYVGIILKKNFIDTMSPQDAGLVDDEEPKQYSTAGHFRSLRYWNWDKPPTKDDEFVRTLEWLSVANAIHKPVKMSDVESTSKN